MAGAAVVVGGTCERKKEKESARAAFTEASNAKRSLFRGRLLTVGVGVVVAAVGVGVVVGVLVAGGRALVAAVVAVALFFLVSWSDLVIFSLGVG